MDFFASATAEAKKFGEAINRVRTVSGASKAELAGLKDNIKDLSNELGLSSQSLADASFEIASAGIAVKDIP